MSSIDERIVGMQFDNAQFEKGLGTSIKSLGQLEKSLDLKGGTKGLTGIASAAGKLSFDGLAKAAETVNSRLSNLGIIGVAALTRIANSAIDAGVRIAKSLSIEPIMAGASSGIGSSGSPLSPRRIWRTSCTMVMPFPCNASSRTFTLVFTTRE